jgi:regulator of sigma E protease
MTGENMEPANDPRSFHLAPALATDADRRCRPNFNFLLTLSLMWFYFAFINEVPAVTVKTTTVEWVTPGSAAATAGIETGDVDRELRQHQESRLGMVYDHIRLNANQTVPVAVERGGNTLN